MLLLAVAAVPGTLRAQVAGYGFSQNNSPYVPITGGIVIAAQSQITGQFNVFEGIYTLPAGAIPFPFVFNGNTYAGGYVSGKGFMTFGSVRPYSYFDPRPHGGPPYAGVAFPLSSTDETGYEGAIAAIGGNLRSQSNGEIRYETIGSAPNRVFVLQWSHAVVSGSGEDLNFQIRLHETSNEVELAYGTCTSGTQSNTVQVGLRGSTPSDFQNRSGQDWTSSTVGLVNTATLPIQPGVVPPAGLRFHFLPAAPQPCPLPFSLVATNLTGTTATLTWRTLGSSPGPYQVVYGPVGFNPATATPVTAAASGLVVTGLTPFTDYEFYVTQTCGAAGNSARSLKGAFKTTLINDDPGGAVALPLTATCQPTASTNAGATLTPASGYDPYTNCGGGNLSTTPDVWFTVTTDATGPGSTGIQLTATGSAANRVRVFRSANGAAGPFTQIACQIAPNNSTTLPFSTFTVAPLTPSTTYYLAVSNISYGTGAGPFTICATLPVPCGAPTNLRINSVLLPVLARPTTVSFTFMPGNGATSYTATLTAPTAPTVVQAVTGSPATVTGLVPATTYSVSLQANCANGGTATSAPLLTYTVPTNDESTAAQVLSMTGPCQPTAGTTINSFYENNLTGNNFSCFGNGSVAGVWYTFTTDATGLGSTGARITTTGTAATVTVFAASSATGPFTQIGCRTGTGVLDAASLTPSTTYYVFVSRYGTTISGLFTICVTAPPLCGDPLGLGITSITGTSATLTFLGGMPAAGSHAVVVTPQGGVALPPITTATPNTQIPLTGLLPGTYYTVTVQANCGAVGLSSAIPITFRTPGVPANDACAGAISIACGQTLPGTTTGASLVGDNTTACAPVPITQPGVWYRVAGTGQDLTAATNFTGNGNTFDNRLHVFSGACGSLVCVASAAPSPSTTAGSSVTFSTTAGTTYYVLVSGQDATLPAQGDFSLRLTCATANACPPPTNLVVTAGPGNSAQVNFTPAIGATGYAVRWNDLTVPQVFQQNAAGPPVVRSGVAAGHNYSVQVTTTCAGNTTSPTAFVLYGAPLASRAAALTSEVTLFPNPAHATATLVLPAALRAAPVGGQLYNALGQVVQSLALPAGSGPATLDLHGLPAGGYLLRLTTAQGVIGKRLMVE